MPDDKTRATLILRVRDQEDQTAWRDFAGIYTPIITAYARKIGVPGHEVDDVIQEVLWAVMKLVKEFDYDPSKGKFRSWLRSITHRRILKYRSGKKRTPINVEDTQIFKNVTDEDAQLENYWDEQWRKHVLNMAMLRACKHFDPKTMEVFRRYVIEQQPPGKVADEMGMSVSNVYVCKSRVLDRLKQEVETLDCG
jgi:RNA polymerase sigma-70 factor, ECF subfamily